VTGQDALLHEANRTAHEVARAAGFYWRWHTYAQNNSMTCGELRQYEAARRKLNESLDAYSDADRRAQLEATA
jgi:hypothetical protein